MNRIDIWIIIGKNVSYLNISQPYIYEDVYIEENKVGGCIKEAKMTIYSPLN